MANIPAGSLAFTGYGDSGDMRFYSPTGVDLGQPVSAPDCGAGVDGIVAMIGGGRIGLIGGNTPNFGTTGVGIFNTDFTVRAEGAAGAGGFFPGRSVARDDAGRFYGVKRSNGVIYRYDEDGAVLAEWDTPDIGVDTLGVNGAGTIAYYVKAATLDTVEAWDLVGDVSLGTFVTGAAGYEVSHNGALALSNGEVLIAWKQGSAAGYVTHYDAAGATLYTYSLSGTNPAPVVLTPGLSASSFLVAYYDDDLTTYSGVRIAEIVLTSGAVSNSFAPEDGTFQFDGPFCVLRASAAVNLVTVAPPLAPQTPCTPQAAIGSGGKGNSGCTVGGIGRTPTYAGAYGTVAEHADPVDGELFMNREGEGIEPWIEMPHVDDPSAVLTTYRRAFVELGDPHTFEGGRKPRALISLGAVQNSLGNEQGRQEAAHLEIVVSDADDLLIRTLMATQELEGDEIRIKMASDALRNL